MDHLSIPIPDDMPEDQKRDLTGYLTQQVEKMTFEGPMIDDDPQVRAEIVQRIKRGMEDIKAGRFMDAREAMRELAKKHDIELDQ